jgi:phosphotransferase system enzyme I (PtsI)
LERSKRERVISVYRHDSDDKIEMTEIIENNSITLNGIAASPGIVIGEAYVISPMEQGISQKNIRPEDVEEEIGRFKEAIKKTRDQLQEVKNRLHQKFGTRMSRIFDSHLLILEDVLAVEKTVESVRTDKVSAEYAFTRAISEVIDTLMEVEDDYLRERVSDIKDVKMRVINNLLGFEEPLGLNKLKKRCVIIAHELSPSMTARADRHQLLGIVTDLSGTTSHAAILAQSFEIPAVIGLGNSTYHIKTGDTVIVDGMSGVVLVNPTVDEKKEYQNRIRRVREFEEELALLRDLPSNTIDGYKIVLAANMEFPDELLSVMSHGAEGIGLFRTEYLFLTRGDLPSEDEQFRIFKTILQGIKPDPVVIRTFDIGADKRSNLFEIPNEKNPFLGWRGVRLALDNEEIFLTHLRAMLRASPYGNLHIMFPMVTSLQELKDLFTLLDRVEEDLKSEGHKINPGYQRGVMIETPSSVFVADNLADEVDFLSLGTNDLIQYLLAVDRGNERVAHMYDPFDPAVVRSIRDVVEKAKSKGKWVGVCGEMAGNSLSAALLIGLGIDELSTSPIQVPKIKRLIRNITISEARDLAGKVLKMKTSGEIHAICEKFVGERLEDAY